MPTVAFPMVPAFDSDAFSAAGGHVRSQTWLDDAGVTRTRSVKWLFNDTGAALTAGRLYVVRYNADADQNPSAAVLVAAPSDTPELVAVALTALANQTWGWFAVEGYTEALVEGTTDCTKGDYLAADVNIISGGGIKEDSTTRTKNSFAIYQDDTDQTTNSAESSRLIYMFGTEVEILA